MLLNSSFGHYRKMLTQLGMAVKRPAQFASVARSEILMRLGVPTLRSVEFQVTHACNLDCDFCYAADIMKNPDRKKSMKLDKVLSTIHECYDLGLIHINITGGEPLLRKDVMSIVDGIPKSVIVSLVTNSSLLTRPILDDLKDAGLSTIQMSYGSNYTDFDRDLARYCNKIGVSVTLSIVNVLDERDNNIKALEMAKEDGYNILYNYPMRFNNSGLDSEFYWENRALPMVREDNMFWSGKNKCPAGLTKIYITNDGDVSACDRIHGFYGNIYETPVKDLWTKLRKNYAGRTSFCILETDPDQWDFNNKKSGKTYPVGNIGKGANLFDVVDDGIGKTTVSSDNTPKVQQLDDAN